MTLRCFVCSFAGQAFSWLQLAGFVVLLFGTVVYNELVHVPVRRDGSVVYPQMDLLTTVFGVRGLSTRRMTRRRRSCSLSAERKMRRKERGSGSPLVRRQLPTCSSPQRYKRKHLQESGSLCKEASSRRHVRILLSGQPLRVCESRPETCCSTSVSLARH